MDIKWTIHVGSKRSSFLYTETVKLGTIAARDAYSNLIIDAEILVDKQELESITNLPDIATALQQVVRPTMPVYTGKDWRAKQSIMRDIQWQKRPIIEYIASTYKDEIIKAINSKFNVINDDWRKLLFTNPKYKLESNTIQLSYSDDKNWRSVFVQITLDLNKLIEKLENEFETAFEAGTISNVSNQKVFKSTLTGFETLMKELDPYAGAKLSTTKIHNREIADEPGYDLAIREVIYERIENFIEMFYSNAKINQFTDDGLIYFTAEDIDSVEEIASDIE